MSYEGMRGSYFTTQRADKVEKTERELQKRVKKYDRELELKERARKLVLSKSLPEARARLQFLLRDRLGYRRGKLRTLVESLIRHKEGLFVHLTHRSMPHSNNLVENLIKQFVRRLKSIEGFRDVVTARGYLNLLVMCQRFKPYSDCTKTK